MLEQLEQYIGEVTYTFPVFGTIYLTPFFTALFIFITLNIVFWLMRKIVLVRLESLSRYTLTNFDDAVIDAVRSIKVWVYSIVSIYVALRVFELPEWAEVTATAIFLVAVVWQFIEVAICFVNYGVKRYLERSANVDGVYDPDVRTAVGITSFIVKTGLWILGGLFVLSNLGIEVTALLAGLGVGGIAIAFALQGVLSDLFASLSIYFDRPFKVGDYIVVNDYEGTVEKIGIQSTRIRSSQGEELVFPNSELISAQVQNFQNMQERRISTTFGIAYETDHELVVKVPGIVEEIFENIKGAHIDRIHFASFGDSALIYELVYFVESADHYEYMDRQQEFNLALSQAFNEVGIEFAYPTQVIYTKKAG